MIDKSLQKRFKAIGHQLNPIVTIGGNGLSDSVLTELNRALDDHELIKIKIHAEDREDRAETLEALTKAVEFETVQTIGNVALLYRKAAKPNKKLSNILRSEIL